MDAVKQTNIIWIETTRNKSATWEILALEQEKSNWRSNCGS